MDAFNRLVLADQHLAYHCASTLVSEPDMAEGIAQESFIEAFQNIASFRGDSFHAWLLKVVTHTTYDPSRRRRKHPAVPAYVEAAAVQCIPVGTVNSRLARARVQMKTKLQGAPHVLSSFPGCLAKRSVLRHGRFVSMQRSWNHNAP